MQKKQYRGKDIASAEVNRPELRLKLWTLENRLLAHWASENGLLFLSAPDNAKCADGYLAESCYGHDATHANQRYGELVLDQIAGCLRAGILETRNHG